MISIKYARKIHVTQHLTSERNLNLVQWNFWKLLKIEVANLWSNTKYLKGNIHTNKNFFLRISCVYWLLNSSILEMFVSLLTNNVYDVCNWVCHCFCLENRATIVHGPSGSSPNLTPGGTGGRYKWQHSLTVQHKHSCHFVIENTLSGFLPFLQL